MNERFSGAQAAPKLVGPSRLCHSPPLVGGQLPAGRPVTPAAHLRLTAGSRCARPQRRRAGGGTYGGTPERLCGARRLAPELRTFGCVGCNRGVSGVLRVPALRSRVSARNGIECASRVELSVRHAQTLSPARPASSSSRAAGKVSGLDAVGFAADLGNDFAASLPRRGRVGGRKFSDCF